MKTKKKAFGLILAAVLLVCVSVLGTVAYLTSHDEVNNTFTVGNVDITMNETKVDEYGKPLTDTENRGTENTYKLLPGHEYTKDPIIHVTEGSENCWLFVKVNNQLTDIEASSTTEKPNVKINEQMKKNGWTLVDSVNNIYSYERIVKEKENIPVFGTFTVNGEADISNCAGKTIIVTAYAVQADGFGSAADALTAAPFPTGK